MRDKGTYGASDIPSYPDQERIWGMAEHDLFLKRRSSAIIEAADSLKEILMPSIKTMVRRTPAPMLAEYLGVCGIIAPESFVSQSDANAWLQVERLIKEATEPSRARFLKGAERIGSMADEAGQAALFEVCRDPAKLDALNNGLARATWVYVHDQASFRHAEEARFTDEHRHGRIWEGFIGQSDLEVRRSPEVIEAFKAAIRDKLGSPNVHVDLFERNRSNFKDEKQFQIVQATVYQEGRADDFPEFVNVALQWRLRRPVYEAAVTYEPATGVIEVVASQRDRREDLVRLFAEKLLGIAAGDKRLPFRQFDLDVLLRPYDFPTDEEDAIESVRVTQLRLMPLDTAGERMSLECSRTTPRTIWEMAERFGPRNPLLGGWIVTKAKVAIRFHPTVEHRRSKVLPLTVTMPHGCDLKERTERERVVGEKYLQRWGILRDVR